ncbi:hypothetical protein LGT39_06305 [Demequina sp. TTPB684]|uniref:hypothetical protein n=1 Tax=unclassified Demequina TaxID=2620311 RepID=UPI001CF2A23C|nr:MULTISPECIES: hypothetical protein [unclassified Demequina]MCB2412461.1 hypothetical protein [Demequina sp. TTPB684]UPU87705.1 hypothetical protein LGT36_010640 [Demequina sp. TMPB413]
MGIDLAGHNVPASTDAPARSAFDKLSLTIRDPLPVADAAARTTLLASLAAASTPVVPSTSSPIFFYQEDLPAAHRVIWTVDGDNFISTSGHYVWADDAERGAATGMVAGDLGFQVDTKITWRHNGTAWKGWESDWIAYTATLTGFAVGTGGSALAETKYRFEQGRVRVDFKFIFGTTGATFPTTPKFTYPAVTPVTPFAFSFFEGHVTYATNAGATAPGWIVADNTSTTTVRLGRDTGSGGSTALDYPTPTSPITFAAGSTMQGSFIYTPV